MVKKVILISIYLFIYGCNGCNSESPTDPFTPTGCTDSTACNYNSDAEIDDGSCEFTSCSNYPTNSLWFSFVSEDTWSIYYNSNVEIGGFQFKLEGVEILSVSDGVAQENGFSVTSSGSMILGFSFSGATLPSGTQHLINVELTDIPTSISEIVISDANSSSVEFIFYDSYFTSNLTQTGESHLIIFSESITSLEVGDEIGVFDSNAILNYNNCNNSIGELLVGAGEWIGEQLEVVNIGSIDHCSIGGVQLAGYKSGNPIILKVWDESTQILHNATYTVSDGNDTFIPPFTVISEITF